ncbi:MAG: hypothetical protein ACR2P1_14880 [Pseudomonadales bacterium]
MKKSLALLLLISMPSFGAVIFSDNFDATPDWQNDGSQRCNWIGFDQASGGDDCAKLPRNYDLVYVSDANPTKPMCEINAKGKRGGSGKGLRVTDESNGGRSKWGSDCQIAKYLGRQYSELWASFYIKYNPNMNYSGASKIFRVGHYRPTVVDGTEGISVFNTDKTTESLGFLDTKQAYADIFRLNTALRCTPEYKCGSYDEAFESRFSPSESWRDTIGDGNWHLVEVQVVMNSAPGKGNGVWRVYWDGKLHSERTNVPWRMAGADSKVTGFNLFTIAGNSNNVWAGQTNAEQHMYDVDDVKVCTTRCGGGVSPASPPVAETSKPESPVVTVKQ